MRISRINLLPSKNFGLGQIRSLGLRQIRMERLGKLVVIAGKNGSGKSRLFSRLTGWLNEPVREAPNVPQLADFFRAVNSMVQEYEERKKRRETPSLTEFNSAIERIKSNYLIDAATLNQIEFSEWGFPNIIHFVPTNLNLDNPNTQTKASLIQAAKSVEQIGVSNLARGTLADIQVLQNQYWEATHPNATFSTEIKEKIFFHYEGLRDVIKEFLGCELTRSPQGDAELFGLPLGEAQLSNGQKVLLQFCVAIYEQADKLKNLIVLMDEPENHLHPGAMLDAIEAIEKHLTNGQLWIATHSVPLLANFDAADIWWMEDSGVSYAGDKPSKVLRGLIGDEERIAKLGDFLNLPSVLASNRFAQQCLISPQPVDTGRTDPQIAQIREMITRLKPSGSIRLLDFGAGRGRLASAISESAESDPGLLKRIDYIAFDIDPTYKLVCEIAIQRLYEKSDNRYFNNLGELLAIYDKGRVDVVVMCNVFHEIDPHDWPDLFNAHRPLFQLLRDEGFVLIVEDMRMPIGEKAYQRGFLVLNTPHLKTLFKIGEQDKNFFIADARGDGRLKAHLISKSYLARMTTESRRETLNDVAQDAKDKIQNIRAGGNDYTTGRLHGFYVQQFANAHLALSRF